MKSLLFCFVIATSLSCRPQVEVDSLHFLDGDWKEMAGRPLESWEITPTGMAGIGFSIEGEDTLVYEKLELLTKKGVLIYAATPKESDSTLYFPLTRHEQSEWTFGNPYNDFPSSITYRKNSNTQMLVILKGNQRDVRFLFDKIQP